MALIAMYIKSIYHENIKYLVCDVGCKTIFPQNRYSYNRIQCISTI